MMRGMYFRKLEPATVVFTLTSSKRNIQNTKSHSHTHTHTHTHSRSHHMDSHVHTLKSMHTNLHHLTGNGDHGHSPLPRKSVSTTTSLILIASRKLKSKWLSTLKPESIPPFLSF